MDWQSGLDEQFLSFGEQESKPDKKLADPITTPRKGPLVLVKSIEGRKHEAEILPRRSGAFNTNKLPSTRQHCLNRFPVPNIQRPIDAIESTLGGGLSFAQLKQQAITVSYYMYISSTYMYTCSGLEGVPMFKFLALVTEFQ